MIIREEDYIAMPTDFLRYKGISLMAKGVLAMLHALDDGNGVDTAELCKHCNNDEPAVVAAVNELQDHSFLVQSEENV